MEAIRDRDDEIRERLCAQDQAGRLIGNQRFHKATQRQFSRRVRAFATRWTGRSSATQKTGKRGRVFQKSVCRHSGAGRSPGVNGRWIPAFAEMTDDNVPLRRANDRWLRHPRRRSFDTCRELKDPAAARMVFGVLGGRVRVLCRVFGERFFPLYRPFDVGLRGTSNWSFG